MSREELVQVAKGESPADVVVTNGRLVNVHSGEIYAAAVAIKGDRIAAVGDVGYTVGPGPKSWTPMSRYLCPGFDRRAHPPRRVAVLYDRVRQGGSSTRHDDDMHRFL